MIPLNQRDLVPIVIVIAVVIVTPGPIIALLVTIEPVVLAVSTIVVRLAIPTMVISVFIRPPLVVVGVVGIVHTPVAMFGASGAQQSDRERESCESCACPSHAILDGA